MPAGVELKWPETLETLATLELLLGTTVVVL